MAENLGTVYWRVEADTTDLKKAEAEMDGVGRKADVAGKKADKLGGDLEKTGKRGSMAMKTLGVAVAAVVTSQAVRAVVGYADAWQNATNQLKTVQKETENLTATQSMLMKISNESRQGFESTANLYTRLTRSTHSMGLSQSELIDLTNTINKSFAVSGASAQEASNAIIQLSQGLAAGALRGEEFNSVSEQSPILMQAIADHLQMTRGELREFAAEGGITAEIVVQSLQKASGEISDTFEKMTPTVEQSMTVLGNSLLGAIGELDQATGASESLANGIMAIADAISAIPKVMESDGFQAYLTWMYHATTLTREFFGLFRSAGELIGLFEEQLDGAGEGMEGFIGPARAFIGPMQQVAEATGAATGGMSDMEKATTEIISKLEAEIAALTMTERELFILNAQTAKGVELDEQYKSAIAAVAARLYDQKAAQEASNAALEAANELQKEQNEALAKARSALNNQAIAARLSARDQHLFNYELELLAKGYAPEAIAELMALEAATYDNAAAAKFWTEAAKNGAKERTAAEEAAQEASSRNFERTHEYITQFILDSEEGGNAVERLGDIAVETAKRIAAEWLALKAMNLFGISLPGGGSGGTGSGATGSIVNSIIGRGASSVAGSVAAGFGGGGGITGAILGNGTAGSGLVGAAGNAYGSISGVIGAIPGWGWAAMGAAAVAAALAKDPTPSTNAGILVGPAPGADPSRTFALDPFASGFQAQGFARREDRSAAMEIANAFAGLDERLTNAIRAAGGNVDLSKATLSGFSETGQGDGVFLGMASEKGKGVTSIPIEDQLAMYAQDLFRHVEGLDEELLNAVRSASSAEEAIRLLSEATQGQEESLNNWEKNQKSAAESVVAAYESGMSELDSIDLAYRQFQQFAERGLTSEAIANFTGFMASEIDAVLSAGEARASALNARKSPYGGFSLFGSGEERLALLGIDGSHANGLDYVPHDGYIAELHKGERVMTASEARGSDGGVMASRTEQLLMQIAMSAKRSNGILDDWDVNGLPQERAALL